MGVNPVQSFPFTIGKGNVLIAPTLLFYQLLLAVLVLTFLVIHAWWRDHPRITSHNSLKLDKVQRTRSKGKVRLPSQDMVEVTGAIPPGYPASPDDQLLYQLTWLPATLVGAKIKILSQASKYSAFPLRVEFPK